MVGQVGTVMGDGETNEVAGVVVSGGVSVIGCGLPVWNASFKVVRAQVKDNQGGSNLTQALCEWRCGGRGWGVVR